MTASGTGVDASALDRSRHETHPTRGSDNAIAAAMVVLRSNIEGQATNWRVDSIVRCHVIASLRSNVTAMHDHLEFRVFDCEKTVLSEPRQGSCDRPNRRGY